MDTSKAPHRVNTEAADWVKWSQFKSTQPVNTDPVEFASLQHQRQVFRNFLRQRQVNLIDIFNSQTFTKLYSFSTDTFDKTSKVREQTLDP